MTDMTTASAAPPIRGGQKTIPPLKANLSPLDRYGQYLIEVAGVSIKSRFPCNRMAKALLLAGLTGQLKIYARPDPPAERISSPPRSSAVQEIKNKPNAVLRMSVDIENYGLRQMTETGAGFRFLPWTPQSLAPLQDAAAMLKPLLVDAQKRVAMGEDQREAGTALLAQSFQQTADHRVDKCRRNNAPEDQS